MWEGGGGRRKKRNYTLINALRPSDVVCLSALAVCSAWKKRCKLNAATSSHTVHNGGWVAVLLWGKPCTKRNFTCTTQQKIFRFLAGRKVLSLVSEREKLPSETFRAGKQSDFPSFQSSGRRVRRERGKGRLKSDGSRPSLPPSLLSPFLPSPRGNISKNDFSIWACRGGGGGESEVSLVRGGFKEKGGKKGGRIWKASIRIWYGKSMEGGGDGGVGGEIRNFIPIHRPRRGGTVGYGRGRDHLAPSCRHKKVEFPFPFFHTRSCSTTFVSLSFLYSNLGPRGKNMDSFFIPFFLQSF